MLGLARKNSRPHYRGARLFFVLAMALTLGCKREEAPSTDWVVLMDLSGSIQKDQREQWVESCMRIFKKMEPGDSIIVLGISDHTTESAPIFQRSTSRPKEGYLAERKSLMTMRALREEGPQEVRRNFNNLKPSKSTDILGSLERLPPLREGRMRVVTFFSDMLHSTRQINLERTHLGQSTESWGDLFRRAAKFYRWNSDVLEATKVICVLEDIPPGGENPRNNRRVLRGFWTVVFESLGAELVWFESYLPDNLDLRGGKS